MKDAPTSMSRRDLLAGTIGAIGAAGAGNALAGCGLPGDEPYSQPSPDPDWQPGTMMANTDDVEVGGGLIVSDHHVVVTQPAAGTFKAFSATCSHAGCAVTAVDGGTINCPCHDWKFSVADGTVVEPAGKDERFSLPEAEITINGGAIEFA